MFGLVFWRYTSVQDRVSKIERKHIHPHTEAQRPGEEKASEGEGPGQSEHTQQLLWEERAGGGRGRDTDQLPKLMSKINTGKQNISK